MERFPSLPRAKGRRRPSRPITGADSSGSQEEVHLRLAQDAMDRFRYMNPLSYVFGAAEPPPAVEEDPQPPPPVDTTLTVRAFLLTVGIDDEETGVWTLVKDRQDDDRNKGQYTQCFFGVLKQPSLAAMDAVYAATQGQYPTLPLASIYNTPRRVAEFRGIQVDLPSFVRNHRFDGYKVDQAKKKVLGGHSHHGAAFRVRFTHLDEQGEEVVTETLVNLYSAWVEEGHAEDLMDQLARLEPGFDLHDHSRLFGNVRLPIRMDKPALSPAEIDRLVQGAKFRDEPYASVPERPPAVRAPSSGTKRPRSPTGR